ncbi:unnamed protein product [Rotaria sordida]|uniref:Hexosyltransferase n=4 Tax=Rotaria sordida TaxID=392033 RepID=A0A814GLT7_9BILA|nr:unnamed protein product [Rotaria sordida]CAF1385705.1 unnamed protein product [Rotaria sordida]
MRQYCRLLSSIKILLLILIFFVIILHSQIFNKNKQWCDPGKPLWWFCPWPDARTICSWDDHFPITDQQIRSPEYYEKLFSSLPKIQSPFEFNNSTFVKCTETSIDILIFVISKCSHASIRQSIRRTWGNTKLLKKYFPNIELKLLFLVDIDSKSEKKIELEYKYHKDIVQVNNLPEQYEYVTEREAALYEFIKLHCKQTKFIFKTDDDIFINTFLLLLSSSKNNFQYLTNNKTIYSLFGSPIEYGLVVRYGIDQIGQRYVITQDEYSCPRYPIFLSGFGYLMSFKTCSLLINAYQTDSKPFPLSDVYFTGLLPQMMNIQRQTIFQNVDYLYQTKCNEEFFISKKNNPFACAASNEHFIQKESDGVKSFMNDYNLYWTKLIEKYNTLKINT